MPNCVRKKAKFVIHKVECKKVLPCAFEIFCHFQRKCVEFSKSSDKIKLLIFLNHYMGTSLFTNIVHLYKRIEETY